MAEPSEGGRQLAIVLQRESVTRREGEARCHAASGFFTRLINGERKPGRLTAIAIEKEFGIGMDLWDRPPRTPFDPRAPRTGTDG